MAATGNDNITISTYYPTPTAPQQITAAHINKAMKATVKTLGLERFGFATTQVGSHSLRAGGAMAMQLNGIDATIIKKHGRWSSNTFLTYIHEQIGALTAGVSHKMATYIPFYNFSMPGPHLIEP